MRRIRASEFRSMAWKNGGGTTTELFVEPEGGTLAGGFVLRLSSAEVATSGPFSPFPGCERLLVLLRGQGMTLTDARGGRRVLGAVGAVARFSGDEPMAAELHDGPIRDLNVIWARAEVDAAIELPTLRAPLQRAAPPRGVLLAYVLGGRLEEADEGELLVAREELRVTPVGQAALALVTVVPLR